MAGFYMGSNGRIHKYNTCIFCKNFIEVGLKLRPGQK